MAVAQQQLHRIDDSREREGRLNNGISRIKELMGLTAPRFRPWNQRPTTTVPLLQDAEHDPLAQQAEAPLNSQPTTSTPGSTLSRSGALLQGSDPVPITIPTKAASITTSVTRTTSASTARSTTSSLTTTQSTAASEASTVISASRETITSQSTIPTNTKCLANDILVQQQHSVRQLINGHEAIMLDKTHSALPTMPVPIQHQTIWKDRVRARLEDELVLKFQMESHLEFLMVSDARGRICPCILITCWDDKMSEDPAIMAAMSRRLQKQVRKYQSLRNCPFPCKVIVDKISLAAKQAQRKSDGSLSTTERGQEDNQSLVGIPICASTDSEACSVLGGLLSIRTETYGLTVAHPFVFRNTTRSSVQLQDFSSSDTGDESEMDDSDDDMNLFDKFSNTETATLDYEAQDQSDQVLASRDTSVARSDKQANESFQPTQEVSIVQPSRRLGIVYEVSDATSAAEESIAIDHDWALIQLDDTISVQPNTYSGLHEHSQIHLNEVYETMLSPGLEVLVLADQKSPVEGIVGQCDVELVIDGMRLLVCQIIVPEPMARGISGSWVVKDDLVVGCVVAVRRFIPMIYMVPMKHIFASIQSRFDTSDISFAIPVTGDGDEHLTAAFTDANTRDSSYVTIDNDPSSRSSVRESHADAVSEKDAGAGTSLQSSPPLQHLPLAQSLHSDPNSASRERLATDRRQGSLASHNGAEATTIERRRSNVFQTAYPPTDGHSDDPSDPIAMLFTPKTAMSLFTFYFQRVSDKILNRMSRRDQYTLLPDPLRNTLELHELLDDFWTDKLDKVGLKLDTDSHTTDVGRVQMSFSDRFSSRMQIGRGLEDCVKLQRQRPAETQEEMSSSQLLWKEDTAVSQIGMALAQQLGKITAISRSVDLPAANVGSLKRRPLLAGSRFSQPVYQEVDSVNKSESSYFFPQDPDVPDWKPSAMRPAYLLFLILLASALAGTQEYVLQRYQRDIATAFDTPGFLGVANVVPFKFLSITAAVIFANLYSSLDLNVRRLEPYHQLAQPRGSSAERSLSLDYLTVLGFLTPFKAARLRQWAVVLSSTCYILASVVAPTLQSVSIYLHYKDFCESEASQPCPTDDARASVSALWSRLTTLCYLSVIIMTGILFIPLHRKSGLLSDLKGIASIASMATESHILHDFRGLDTASQSEIDRHLANRRFVLYRSSIWQGELESEEDRSLQKQLKGSGAPKPAILRLYVGALLCAYVLLLCSVMAVVMVRGPARSGIVATVPWLLMLMITVLKPLFATLHSVICLMEPFRHLQQGNSRAKQTLTVDYCPQSWPFFIFSAFRNRHFRALESGSILIVADLLAITMGSITAIDLPNNFSVGRQHVAEDSSSETRISLIFLWFTMVIFLLITSAILTFSIYWQWRRPLVPRMPSTISSIMAYIYSSRMLEHFIGTERYSNKKPEEKLQYRGKRYGFGWFHGRDGKIHCGIDEEPIMSSYRHGMSMNMAIAGQGDSYEMDTLYNTASEYDLSPQDDVLSSSQRRKPNVSYHMGS